MQTDTYLGPITAVRFNFPDTNGWGDDDCQYTHYRDIISLNGLAPFAAGRIAVATDTVYGPDLDEIAPHYHVHQGMRGYLPNSTFYAETRKMAEDIAKEEVSACRDAGYKMRGSAKRGWYEGGWTVNEPFYYVEIVQCSDLCDPNEENY
jgi:hypothetical protein